MEEETRRLELEYRRGFNDCASLILHYAGGILSDIPENASRFSLLLQAIESVYSVSIGKLEAAVKDHLGITWEIPNENTRFGETFESGLELCINELRDTKDIQRTLSNLELLLQHCKEKKMQPQI